MKLIPITRNEFSLWSQFRSEVYPLIDGDYDRKEMDSVFTSDAWFCWFIEREDGERVGLVELSIRNIVDGCLSSPVPYLEGFYLVSSERGKGVGSEVIEFIKHWSREQGYSELATDAELSNTKAQVFYEKLGFEKVDQVVEYKIKL